MNIDASLVAAYSEARYVIETVDGPLIRRIGVVDMQADAMLEACGCRQHWWLVTPCNPGSQLLSEADNAARLARCAAELHERHWPIYRSSSTAPDGHWLEHGFCILDVPAAAVVELARHYQQAAIVGGELGGAPELIWL